MHQVLWLEIMFVKLGWAGNLEDLKRLVQEIHSVLSALKQRPLLSDSVYMPSHFVCQVIKTCTFNIKQALFS